MAFWRRDRAEDKAEPGTVVLGRQMADAAKAEKRHRRRLRHSSSPLEDVEYDPATGALDLHRWVESDVDAAVGAFVSSYLAMSAEEAAETRAALTMDDFYTLLAFARRSALASLRGQAEPSLRGGLAAVSAVALERLDFRDAQAAAELVAWAMARAGIDHAAELRRLKAHQEEALSEALRPLADRPASELGPGPWRCVESGGNPVLAWDGFFGPYQPTLDVVRAATAVGDVLERDVYRVTDLQVAVELPDVWLTRAGGEEVGRALEGLSACLSVGTRLDPAATRRAEDQQLTVFLAEAATGPNAATVAGAAVSTKSFEALGVACGRACCVVVARSFVKGVRSYERPGTLERFREPVTVALREAL
jgi:hypothetical protein